MAENGFADEKQKLLLQEHEHEHEEKHFMSSEIVRDIIIGVSDGLTVPFALAAGLSGANVTSNIILIAGIAEVAAGAISMGLGGYLAAKSEADHYMKELKREQEEIISVPDIEADECGKILGEYGVEADEYEGVIKALRRNPEHWVNFMMRFELGLEKPNPMRAIQSALTIATSYIVGGMVPLSPYIIFPLAREAMYASVVVTILALLIFGYVKGYFTGNKPFKSAFQTALIGAIASAAAFSLAKLFRL
ncbi:vacuolar iron transporter 1-like [Euphorbia lathyris]|uniref:vacuolar iron transporter 1-like n=1 Tax=Euphorbia lathyris TaxID=212925 RepID=UPI003313ACDA